MKSADAAKRGSQVPRVLSGPTVELSDYEDAVVLARGYDLPPDPWQELVLMHWLAYTPAGLWLSKRLGLAVPRQNGKNAVLEIFELHVMINLGMRVLHTAHEVKTA